MHITMPPIMQIAVSLNICTLLPINWDLVRQYVPADCNEEYAVHPIEVRIDAVSDRDLDGVRGNLAGSGYAEVREAPGATCSRRLVDSTTMVIACSHSHIVRVHFDNDSPYSTVPCRVEFLLSSRNIGDPGPEAMLLRLYRDILQHVMHLNGFYLLHCSVAAIDGNGVVFVGRRGTGKTAWLLRTLQHGWDYVSNDRAFVNPATGEVVAYPLRALISRESAKHIPSSVSSAMTNGRMVRNDLGIDKISISPGELSLAFGVGHRPECQASRLMILEPTDGSDDQEDTEPCDRGNCTGVLCAIRENLYYPTDPNYAFDVYCRPLPRTACAQAAVIQVFRAMPTSRLRFTWPAFDRNFVMSLPVTPEIVARNPAGTG